MVLPLRGPPVAVKSIGRSHRRPLSHGRLVRGDFFQRKAGAIFVRGVFKPDDKKLRLFHDGARLDLLHSLPLLLRVLDGPADQVSQQVLHSTQPSDGRIQPHLFRSLYFTLFYCTYLL